VPASSGWHQVLGSVALFAFLTQFFTGVLLAFNYAPTPGEAYDSLRYIVTELTAGRIIRGLHHWGASLMIVVVVLHMTQVFLWGAYKKPREATWIVGVVLLLVTLAYGLTGYLLPWDNRAYWGTVVTTQIASQAPGAGSIFTAVAGERRRLDRRDHLRALLRRARASAAAADHAADRDSRLPGASSTASRPPRTIPRQKVKFYPEASVQRHGRDLRVVRVLVAFAVMVKVPLGRMADPTDTSLSRVPKWYFLFLFQLLKLFEGPLEIVGSVILPTLAILVLFLIPFIDRAKMVACGSAFVAIALVLLAAIGWSGLTARAVATTPPSTESATPVWRRSSRGAKFRRASRCDRLLPKGRVRELSRSRQVRPRPRSDARRVATARGLVVATHQATVARRTCDDTDGIASEGARDVRRQARQQGSGGVGECAAAGGGRRDVIHGQPMRAVPRAEWHGQKNGPPLNGSGDASRAGLGGAALCGADAVVARLDHAGLQVQLARSGPDHDVSFSDSE
jgi:hypothetical protein